MKNKAEIAIIGGSGFYDFLKGEEIEAKTPYGSPSDKILLFEYQGKKIAFLPRHGKGHQYPPHKINFRANIFALKELGVKRIIAPCAVGSLKPEIKPGDFVIIDQFIDRTKTFRDTFFDGPGAVHISAAEAYCPDLREIANKKCQELKIPFHPKGTAVIIEGPRFSSRAESEYYSQIADVINMTQYPELILARELEMCYLGIALVTDYDAGLRGRKDISPVSAEEVGKVFRKNNEKVKKLILEIIGAIGDVGNCHCAEATKSAKI